MAAAPARPVSGYQEGLGVALGSLGSLAVVALLVPVREHISAANVALVFVLPVIGGGAFGGRWGAVASAFVAALSFDFFFTAPYLSLRVTSGDDIETMLALGVVSLVAAEMAIRSRRTRESAAAARSELERLRRVADLTASGAEPDVVVSSVQAELCGLLGLEQCQFEPGGEVAADRPRLSRGGAILGGELVYRRDGFELPDGVVLPVLFQDRMFGVLHLDRAAGMPTTLEQRAVAVALADELGLALAARSGGTGPTGRKDNEERFRD